MSHPSPTAIETANWLHSIELIISQHRKTCLVMCCGRDELIQILQTELSNQATESFADEDNGILCPTIARLKASQNIRVIFVSSLAQLRALLSTTAYISKDTEFLSILGMPDLHLSASHLNAQSLSRTLALVIDSSVMSAIEIMFVCPKKMMDHWQEETQGSIWERRLPVLASSIKTGEDRAWSGRTIMMGHVFGQWCEIINMDS